MFALEDGLLGCRMPRLHSLILFVRIDCPAIMLTIYHASSKLCQKLAWLRSNAIDDTLTIENAVKAD